MVKPMDFSLPDSTDSTDTDPKRTQLGPNTGPKGHKKEPKRSQNGTKTDPKRTQAIENGLDPIESGSHVIQTAPCQKSMVKPMDFSLPANPDITETGSKRTENGPKTDRKRTRNGPETDPKRNQTIENGPDRTESGSNAVFGGSMSGSNTFCRAKRESRESGNHRKPSQTIANRN